MSLKKILECLNKMMSVIVVTMIKGYRYIISPLLMPCCRFTPTCSEFCIESINRFGIVKGLYLGGLRILRCNPFHPGGVDHVPASPSLSSSPTDC